MSIDPAKDEHALPFDDFDVSTIKTTSGTAKKIPAFLNALSETGNVTYAAQQSGLRRESAHRLFNNDKTFAKAWDLALDIGNESLVDHVKDRARDPDDRQSHLLAIFTINRNDKRKEAKKGSKANALIAWLKAYDEMTE